MPDQAPDHQAREFAAAFRGFLEWIHSPAAGAGDENEVSALVRDFLRTMGACPCSSSSGATACRRCG
jgi:hypothetical protein